MNTTKVKISIMDKWASSCNIYALYGAACVALMVMILADQVPHLVVLKGCCLGLLFCGYFRYQWLANLRELLLLL